MNTYDSASKSSKTDVEIKAFGNQDAMMYQSFNNHAGKTIPQPDIKIEEDDQIR